MSEFKLTTLFDELVACPHGKIKSASSLAGVGDGEDVASVMGMLEKR